MHSKFTDSSVRLLLSSLEWQVGVEGKVTIGMLIRYWEWLTALTFPDKDQGLTGMHSKLLEVDGITIYDHFFVKLQNHIAGDGNYIDIGKIKKSNQ